MIERSLCYENQNIKKNILCLRCKYIEQDNW